MKTVGVLGGMGPQATILLQHKLVEAIQASDDCDHIPLIIDMNPQVPSRIAYLLEGAGVDPGPTLAAMARRLEMAGATALAMPCNTAHHFAGAITAAVNVPLLNVVERAADHAAETLGRGGCVGILASPAVQRTHLFERAFEARGLTAVWPDNGDAMLFAIRAIKEAGPCPAARETLMAASEQLVAAGARMQLVACSEFSIIADSTAQDANAVDTIDLLVRAIIQAAQADD